MDVLFSFAFILILAYLLLVIKWTLAWILQPVIPPVKDNVKSLKVSVIVAVRNEEQNIVPLLNALMSQQYPSNLLEIIISDDQSNDKTIQHVTEFNSNKYEGTFPVVIVKANENSLPGKKHALERAIEIAHGDLILTTDADCSMSDLWVQSFVDVARKTGAKMITGLVVISPTPTFFSAIQALEFLSLSATGAVSVINKKPLMCNGANLAFLKSAFYEAGGYSYGSNHPSGDDTFLMLKMAKQLPFPIVFNKHSDSIVSTKPERSFSTLISQRIRWASKVTYYNENYIKYTGGFIFLVNLLLVGLAVSAFAGLISWWVVGLLWMIKMLGDFVFLWRITAFSDQQNLLLVFLPAQLIYPFYSLVGGILSVAKNGYIWKGRSIKNG